MEEAPFRCVEALQRCFFCERFFLFCVFESGELALKARSGISEEMGRLTFIACRLFLLLSDGDRP
jgi:hypothetical protein